MIEFRGRIESIIFENDKNLFKIMHVTILTKISKWPLEAITVTGNFGDVKIGGEYTFSGKIVDHPRYGQQFQTDHYREALPEGKHGIVKYLSGSNFPGIGEKTANMIVDELGDHAIETLQNDPQVLQHLKLSQKQRAVLTDSLQKMDDYSLVTLGLAEWGFGSQLATRIYQKYQTNTLEKIKTNPYILINVTGISFKKADALAKQFGIRSDALVRVRGALIQQLQELTSGAGNTYIQNEVLLKAAEQLLNDGDNTDPVSFDKISSGLLALAKDQKVVIEKDRTFLKNLYDEEWNIADQLQTIFHNKHESSHFSDREIEKTITKVEQRLKINYDETQRAAVKMAIDQPISILTGGPGTGKTTVINGILLAYRLLYDLPDQQVFGNDSPFLLAAPTGRAAKRMTEITGVEAKTIHRLLGIGLGENEEPTVDELDGLILIVDEMSMIDMFLFKRLITAIPAGMHVLFVGDKDQLPSVNAGNVFSDLIRTQIIPTTYLQKIHRQAEDSSIINLAHEINEQQHTAKLFTKTKDYSFIECAPSQVEMAIGQIVHKALNKDFDKNDLQVIGAMYSGVAGINHLNLQLQDLLNPKKNLNTKELEVHNQHFRIGDRVLQLVNNPQKDIYNGQIGEIVSLDPENYNQLMTVNFDGREIKLAKVDLNDITLAYAITIHKSQGSEFPVVILILTMQNFRMLQRNLLYTAITRAEQTLIMLGQRKAYELAMATDGSTRQTALAERIQSLLGTPSQKQSTRKAEKDVKKETDHSYILTKEMIVNRAIDPMIGMDDTKLTAK